MTSLDTIKLIGFSLALTMLTMLTGCGDSKISAVKDTRLRGDEFTVGETLNKVKECKSTDWTSEIVNNTTIVTHTCTVNLDDAPLNLAKQGELTALKARADLADLSVTQALSQARNTHASAVRYSDERATQAARRVAVIDQRIQYITARVTESLPPGVVNLVSEDGHAVAQYLTESAEVDVLSFTGSNATGQRIMAAAAPTMKKLSLELGGKSACLVFEDADVEKTAAAIAVAATIISGQQCTAARGVLVHARHYDAMQKALTEALAAQRVAPGGWWRTRRSAR